MKLNGVLGMVLLYALPALACIGLIALSQAKINVSMESISALHWKEAAITGVAAFALIRAVKRR